MRALVGIAVAVALACAPAPGGPGGVFVTGVEPGGAGAQAGLRAGDVLLSFARAAAPPASPQAVAAPLSSCFAVLDAEVEQGPRGPLTVAVRRGAKPLPVTLPPGSWGIATVPRAPRHPARAACEILARARQAYVEDRFLEAATEYERALAAARPLRDPLADGWILLYRGVALEDSGDIAGAEKALAESLARRRQSAPDSLAEAASSHSLGYLEMRRDPERARKLLDRALELRTRWAPQSLVRAQTLNVLGIHFYYAADLARSAACYRQSLALIHRLRPGTDDESQVLNNLGLISRDEGNPVAAEGYFQATARILERIDPRGRGYANVLFNLGILAQDGGDYARAEGLLRTALGRHQQLAAESPEVATILANLGINALEIHGSAEARPFFERALAIQRRLAPGGQGEALALNNLAQIASDGRDLEQAERLATRALSIRRKLAPESGEVAASLSLLGELAEKRGDRRRALALLDQALASKNLPAGASYRATLLQSRGRLALLDHRYGEAEPAFERALAIRRRLSPGSWWEAQTLFHLGKLYARTGRPAAAERSFAAAIAAVETQVGRLPQGDEVRAGMRDEFTDLYRALVALEVERGQPEAALSTLERSRGRGLLAALAERDLGAGSGLPPELLARRRQIDRRYEATQRLLAEEDPQAPGSRVPQLSSQLTALRRERNALAGEIRQRSPRYAALRDPRPLDAAGIGAVLEPGTVLLAYSTGERETLLFAVTGRAAAGGARLRVVHLAVGTAELASQVSAFRSLLLRGRTQPALDAPLADQARRLYAELLAPAAAEIGRAKRLLISPDGPLFHLPFAALIGPGEPAAFLAEAKPVHSVLSMTLYSALQKRRRPADHASPVVVFADPAPPGPPAAGAAAAGSPVRRFQAILPPLPGARDEGKVLASLFDSRASVWTGRDATESRAKALPRSLRYLHFATHALLDPRFPFDSALALATSPGPSDPSDSDSPENGLLQAWEIFDLRLDADLVTLSGCETGLGRDAGGEGLLGLTRAFQYAGARSILASLWEVNDRSTAALMERFYAELKAGAPKDVALARAQLALLREKGGAFAHPYHWAAFELIGDWR